MNRSALHPDRRVRAFTLIELLVVIAIIALLVSILLPSLSAARGQAKKVKCGAVMRDQGSGMNMYFSEYNGWIPGVNTTGVLTNEQRYDNDYFHPDIPVHRYDWITPIGALATRLPDRRSTRFHFVLNYWQCPSIPQETSALYYDATPPDLQDFEKEPAPLPPVSYLMPWYFQFWGQRNASEVVGHYRRDGKIDDSLPFKAETASPSWEVVVNEYKSIVDRVGTPADKIAVYDGTRYLPSNRVLDVDIHPWRSIAGGFADQGGWWQGGTALGAGSKDKTVDGRPVTRPSPSDGDDQKWAYRHGSSRDYHEKALNALFFDNHVESLTNRQSREIRYWYPKGGVVKTPGEGMTKVPQDYVVP